MEARIPTSILRARGEASLSRRRVGDNPPPLCFIGEGRGVEDPTTLPATGIATASLPAVEAGPGRAARWRRQRNEPGCWVGEQRHRCTVTPSPAAFFSFLASEGGESSRHPALSRDAFRGLPDSALFLRASFKRELDEPRAAMPRFSSLASNGPRPVALLCTPGL